jgi:8-oxo-dGTP diphosphatase
VIGVRVEAGVARLSWDPTLDPGAVQEQLTVTAEQLLADGVRRLEIELPADDRLGRRVALRSGFRVEGVRRAVLETGPGRYADTTLYARLDTDVVGGGHGFSAVMNSALPRKRLIAHVLMRDHRGRVLLCDTKFKPDWELPGGIVEPFEAPGRGAVREVAEELGLALALGPLLVVDWMPPYLGWDDALELIFDGGRIEESELPGLRLQPSEIERVALVTLDEAAALVTPLSHRRLSVASGLAPGETAYLENGARPRPGAPG